MLTTLAPVTILLVILFFSFLVESLTEFFIGLLIDNIAGLAKLKPFMPIAPVPIAIFGAYLYQFDLISIMGQYLGLQIALNWLGIILTGLAIARGSNYIHQLVVRFFPNSVTLPTDPSVITKPSMFSS